MTTRRPVVSLVRSRRPPRRSRSNRPPTRRDSGGTPRRRRRPYSTPRRSARRSANRGWSARDRPARASRKTRAAHRVTEQRLPAIMLHPEPALFAKRTRPVTGQIDPLRRGVRDQPFEPVAILAQRLPGEPAQLGRWKGLGPRNFLAAHPDEGPQVLEDRPVRAAAAVFVVGDHFLGTARDDLDPRLPIGAVRRDGDLEVRVTLA